MWAPTVQLVPEQERMQQRSPLSAACDNIGSHALRFVQLAILCLHNALQLGPALPSSGPARVMTRRVSCADVKGNLARLNKGFLVAVEKLIEVLESSPSQYARALEAVLAHLNNMTHLSNMLRPVQARSTLRHMLTSSAEQKRAAIAELRANRENVVSQCTDTALALSSQNF